MRYFVHLSYNGAAYHGWQAQENAPSVQAEIEKCLSLKAKETISLTGCGRTDTGVHARNFFAHFDSETQFTEHELTHLVEKVNLFLPSDIVIHRIWHVYNDLHARFDAQKRTYHYYISQHKNPFRTAESYYIYGNLNVQQMQKAADILFEYDDFTSFAKLHSQTRTNLCKIYTARWFDENGLLVFRVSANRFLRNMVRSIVGTLLEVGKGKLSLNDFRIIIEAKDRCFAGFSAPAHALFLEEVIYEGINDDI